jgi:hypothetical protein
MFRSTRGTVPQGTSRTMCETSGSFRLASKTMFSASITTSESELIFATGHQGAHGPGGRLLLQNG